MASNNTTIFDEDGDASDWIELYNSNVNQINLSGYYLSDDSLNVTKWQFGNVTIEPGGYLLVFASDKDTSITYWHTNFKISTSGERILLSNPAGEIVDQVDLPESTPNISYGRESDGSIIWIFQEPTPGTANTGVGVQEYADPVIVTPAGGFYPNSVAVELSAGDSDIYFTMDGSDPDVNSFHYTTPLTLTETTTLKAISVKASHLPTPVVYHTYFMNETTSLPVISLITDPDNLFDPGSGIYINYEEDWEKPAHIQFYDDDKNLGFSENVAINIYGGYTRRFSQKSLAVKFKSDYGKNKLEYDLFPGFGTTTFKSFILRNSGNDFEQTHIRDAFMQTLVKDLDIDYLEYRPAVAYINGEYWGIYNIREKISEHYVANRYGVDPDNIDMMDGYSAYNDDVNDPDGEYGLWVGNLEVVHGDTVNYKQVIDYLNTEDLTTDAAYDFLNGQIDLDECILYYAAQVYYNSQDWPANNSKYWRERSSQGRWRWILYDLDFGFNLYEWNNEGNSEDHVNYLFSGDPSQRPWSKPVESTFIARRIVQNPKIKNQFVNQVADLLNTNFKSDRVINIMNGIANHIAGDIGRHRARWQINGDNLNRMISFAQNRPGNLRNHVRNFFGAGSDGTLTINAEEGGKIILNSLTLMQDEFPWSGVYFQNNAIHLTAIPEQGYKFAGWSGDVVSVDNTIDVTISRSTDITAIFVVDSTTANDIVINEINYNSSDNFDSGDWIELYNRSNQPVDLSAWYYSDSDTSNKFILPSGTIIESDSYLVIVENESAFTTLFPGVENYISETGFGLSGSGEFMKLVNANEQIIDSLTYDDKTPWPVEADGQGATLELTDAVRDNAVGTNWNASQGHGTPGKINSLTTDIEEMSEVIPSDFALLQNYPNPFNPTTLISFTLPASARVSLKIYDILGREVAELVNQQKSAGNYTVEWNAANLSSGMYIYRIQAGDFVDAKKMILMK